MAVSSKLEEAFLFGDYMELDILEPTLAEEIKFYRRKHSLSIDQFAHLVGIDHRTVRRIENSNIKPRPNTLKWIEEVIHDHKG